MSMTTALSGLIAAQQDISITSHNIANVGTNAFRKSRAEFVDDYYTTPMDSFRTVVGSGTHMSRVAVQFDQGNFAATGQTLDLAIQGPGFFAITPQVDNAGDPTELVYTRNGSFSLDADSRIVDSSGRPMLTWPVAMDGTVLQETEDSLQTVQIPMIRGEAVASDQVDLALQFPIEEAMNGSQDAVPATNAFDPDDPTSYAFQTAIPLTDETGAAIEARAYFVKTANPDATSEFTEYEMRLVVDGAEVPATDPANPTLMQFDGDGILTEASQQLNFSNVDGDFTVNLTGSKLENGTFAVGSASHNGKAPEGLSSLEVDPRGVIWANYGTDYRVALGRVALANFSNPQGLRQDGNASFFASSDSGNPTLTSPGDKGLGLLQSGMLERSNVDLTEELVQLITAQRNYQANAKAMETSSSLMQTIMNIRN